MGAFAEKLPALTSVRFVLALGVVLFHYQLQWSWDLTALTGILERARLGVDVFFILSGFVLTHAYRREMEAGSLHYPRFLMARLARIYPAHLAVLAFVLMMVGAARLMGADFDRSFYNPAGLATTVLLVHAWAPAWIVAEWNGPSWSLSAEWFAYLAFPLFAWLGLKLRERPGALLALSLAAFLGLDALYFAVFGDTVVHAEANLGVLRIIPEFLYGIGLYRLGQKLTPTRRQAIGAALAAGVLLLALMHLQADDRLIVAAAGPLVLGLALLSKAGVDGALARPWMIAAGEASYALYLVHMPALIAWKGAVSALGDRPSSYDLGRWEVGGLLAVTIAAAFALHYVVERPARAWIRDWSQARWPAAIRQGSSAVG
jgi:peptidoglycan/LPS O-acetylase OafA/YrhL